MSSVKTQTQTTIKRQGDKITIIKKITTTTTEVGKDPVVKVKEETDVYEGEEGWKKMPEDIRKQVEDMDKDTEKKEVKKPINKTPTRGDFVDESLKLHNKYRKIHDVKPLELSEELIKYCKERVKHLAEKDEMSKRTEDKYGENISCMWSSDPEHTVSAEEVISRWYSESEKYDFSEEPKDLNAGHFTQMVWKSTKDFGIAAAKSDSNKIYVVAAYHPPGNYATEFKKNVLPGSKSKGIKESLKSWVLSANKSDSSDSSDSDSDDGVSGKLNKESVAVHNEYRKKHGVGPLKYSKEVAKYAQQWADELAKKDKFEHRVGGKYGENLYTFSSSDPKKKATAKDACDSWYSEIKDHTFGSERALQSGHFTQMIWKDSKEVGMGRAVSKTNRQIIVANYSPAGNIIGKYKDNVPRPIH